MTDEFNSPPPGTPQTDHKAWAAALAGLASALTMALVTGEPDWSGIVGYVETLAVAAAGALVSYLAAYWTANRPKP